MTEQKMLTIYYDDGGCGTGKTYRAIETICQTGGRHIFVVDRREVMLERSRLIRELMWDRTMMKIECIASCDDRTAVQRGVRAQIEDAPKEFAEHPNIVVIITHEAMRMADFSAFAEQGWSIWIDEVPSIIDNDSHRVFVGWTKLSEFYDLSPIDEEWSIVTPRDSSIDLAALAHCDGYQFIIPFHRRVCDPRQPVLANVADWGELAVKGRSLTWYAVWTPDQLRHFSAVFMLGNSLCNSMTFHIWAQACPEIEWVPLEQESRQFRPRRVVITYFAEKHIASTALFQTDQGKRNLRKVADYISYRVPQERHIWMANEKNVPSLEQLTGTRLSPMKAGSNAYQYATHVTAIYTAKPAPVLRSIYRRIGIDPYYHVVSAELETIQQFVWRCCLRDPDDDRDIYIYVYDRQQAQYLLDSFGGDPRGYVWADMRLEDLGFALEVRSSKPGRKPKVLTASQLEEAEVLRKAKDAKRKRDERDAAKLLRS